VTSSRDCLVLPPYKESRPFLVLACPLIVSELQAVTYLLVVVDHTYHFPPLPSSTFSNTIYYKDLLLTWGLYNSNAVASQLGSPIANHGVTHRKACYQKDIGRNGPE
jgi:hypothetical protein